jgi:dihydrofolate reductase
MPIFYAIAAMSENYVIGNQGKIPWHIPDDFRWFKHKTMGGTLIMGRKTFESIGEVLAGRKTVVISRTSTPGVETCRDLLYLDQTISTLPEPYWICGGGEIYRQLLAKCDLLYLTRVNRTVPGDAFFPSFFENDFELNQVIHEEAQFRVERWMHKDKKLEFKLNWPSETWPLGALHR